MLTDDLRRLLNQWNPDSWDLREPTDKERTQFTNRVIARFGRKVWDAYNTPVIPEW